MVAPSGEPSPGQHLPTPSFTQSPIRIYMATPGSPSATIPAAVLAAVLLLHVLLPAVPSAAQEVESQGSPVMYIFKGPFCSLPVRFGCGHCYGVPNGSRGYFFPYFGKKARVYTGPSCRGHYKDLNKTSYNCTAIPFKSFSLACMTTASTAELDAFVLEQ